ncbi:MAG: sugar ABC transporter substrate-binding protein [Anaerotruncus sp.]|nr:sugar ABC transporter substrate-binding protein [Anaerotruncus sp.]MCI9235958.1 sugar ABC transporter substrate-binding protein [Anaerotruncus sp.]
MKKIPRIAAIVLAVTLLLMSLAGCSAADGKTHLTFQIWDVAQRDSMQAICDAYTAKNPDVVIEVQVTSWTEYWTKLEAAAESNTMPDIFWMHTNQILYYSDFGMLADVTDLYDDVDPNFYNEHFSEISRNNASGSNGRLYGVPKDKDNIILVYNKEMFDAAGVAYPDDDWTWDDMTDASAKIYETTGKYGFMAYAEDHLGYWNFVYQAGGYILNEDKTKAGFTQPATMDAMKFYIGIQNEEWCPTQTYFAETQPGIAFFSELGSMYLEGNWELMNKATSYPNMDGKWDIAKLPICPNPASGDGRATISNGLCYSTAARGKNLEVVKDVLKYFGTEEAQRLAGSYGVAIPAYNGTEDSYFEAFEKAGYDLDLQIIKDQFDYSIQCVNNASRPKWKSPVGDELIKIYSGQVDIDTGLANMQRIVDDASAAS